MPRTLLSTASSGSGAYSQVGTEALEEREAMPGAPSWSCRLVRM